jgi:hypothetical protein
MALQGPPDGYERAGQPSRSLAVQDAGSRFASSVGFSSDEFPISVTGSRFGYGPSTSTADSTFRLHLASDLQQPLHEVNDCDAGTIENASSRIDSDQPASTISGTPNGSPDWVLRSKRLMSEI